MAKDGHIERGTLRRPSEAPISGERVEVLTVGSTWRVEEILSGQLLEPVDDVLDHIEWVAVLSGRAVLEIDGEIGPLLQGDWIRLEPGIPHRVLATDPGTTWLAVHLELPANSGVRS